MAHALLKKQKGFTLLEMLVAISVFVIITTIALGIYTSIMRANKKSILMTRLQRDAQVIMVAMSKKIRQSQVNYDYSEYTLPISGSVDELAIIDNDGVEYVYKLDSVDDTIQVKTGSGAFKDMPAAQVSITDLDFYISPGTDPFEGTPNAPPTEFPKVTMVLRLEPRNAPAGFTGHMIVQHTVPQRGGGY